MAIGFGLAAVITLTFAYGNVPYVALTLAFSFGFYGFVKNRVGRTATALTSLSMETAILALPALGFMVWLVATNTDTVLSAGPAHFWLLAASGIITAVPLLLFGAAARRLPLTHPWHPAVPGPDPAVHRGAGGLQGTHAGRAPGGFFLGLGRGDPAVHRHGPPTEAPGSHEGFLTRGGHRATGSGGPGSFRAAKRRRWVEQSPRPAQPTCARPSWAAYALARMAASSTSRASVSSSSPMTSGGSRRMTLP